VIAVLGKCRLSKLEGVNVPTCYVVPLISAAELLAELGEEFCGS